MFAGLCCNGDAERDWKCWRVGKRIVWVENVSRNGGMNAYLYSLPFCFYRFEGPSCCDVSRTGCHRQGMLSRLLNRILSRGSLRQNAAGPIPLEIVGMVACRLVDRRVMTVGSPAMCSTCVVDLDGNIASRDAFGRQTTELVSIMSLLRRSQSCEPGHVVVARRPSEWMPSAPVCVIGQGHRRYVTTPGAAAADNNGF